MKLLLCVAALTATAALTRAQGTLNFANSTTTKVFESYNVPVPTASTRWIVGMYWGPLGTPQSELQLIATTRTWAPFTGIFLGSTVTFPVAGGTRVQVQIRAWDAQYARIEDAWAAAPFYYGGYGPYQTITLGGVGFPPGAPNSLTAPLWPEDTPFASFTMTDHHSPIVPEPSVLTLFSSGIAIVALFCRKRRRKCGTVFGFCDLSEKLLQRRRVGVGVNHASNLRLVLMLLIVPVSAFAQGTVNFGNNTSTKISVITLQGPVPVPTSSTWWTVGMYWGPLGTPASELQLIATTGN